jgi:hypothetical protein
MVRNRVVQRGRPQPQKIVEKPPLIFQGQVDHGRSAASKIRLFCLAVVVFTEDSSYFLVNRIAKDL